MAVVRRIRSRNGIGQLRRSESTYQGGRVSDVQIHRARDGQETIPEDSRIRSQYQQIRSEIIVGDRGDLQGRCFLPAPRGRGL
jgi:hypothetical protein